MVTSRLAAYGNTGNGGFLNDWAERRISLNPPPSPTLPCLPSAMNSTKRRSQIETSGNLFPSTQNFFRLQFVVQKPLT